MSYRYFSVEVDPRQVPRAEKRLLEVLRTRGACDQRELLRRLGNVEVMDNNRSLMALATYLDSLAGAAIPTTSAGDADMAACRQIAQNLRYLGCQNVSVSGIAFASTQRLQISFDWHQ